MKTAVEDFGPCRKKLRIEIPGETTRTVHEELLSAYARTAAVPGFRKGRAPRQVVERRYAKDLRQDLRDRLVPDAYRQAVKEAGLDAVAILDVEEPSVTPGEPLAFSVTVDVPPEFDLPAYDAIPVEAHPVAVSAEQVDEALHALRMRFARYEDVSGRPVQADDLAQVSFEATSEGRPLEEQVPAAKGLGKAEGLWLSIGEMAFLPDLAEGLKGAAVGEERTVEVTFREGFTVKELAGRQASYRATVTAVRQPVPAELDAEFLGRFGAAAEEDLRARIRDDLETQGRTQEAGRRRDQIARHLLEKTRMDLPESLLQRETSDRVYSIVQENARRGVAQDQIAEHKEQIYRTASRTAAEALKLRYVMHRIAEAEGIEVGADELEAELARMAQSYGMEPEALRARMAERGAMDDLRERMRHGKVMDRLVEKAKLTEASGDPS